MKHILTLSLAVVLLAGCDKSKDTTPAAQGTDASTNTAQSELPLKKAIPPEDDPKLTGTPVLGFKLRQSTYESVQDRLQNYKTSDGVSYADGPILENDGSGFDIDGIKGTQFGFDGKNKLVYVWMTVAEADKMNNTTYKKVVSFVKQRGYKVVRSVEPFVGSRSTEFLTPNNEIITVSAPHMDFNVYAEYTTKEFDVMRSKQQQQSNKSKTQKESSNF